VSEHRGIKMKLFSSRKSQVELSLQQVIGLVIAIIIVLASLGLFFGLMNIFVGPPDSGSVRTLNIIMSSVEALHDPHNTNTSCSIQAEYIEGDWSIVGFNTEGIMSGTKSSIRNKRYPSKVGEDSILETCGDNDEIEKPPACGNGPCICLCEGGGATGAGDVDGDDCRESNAICRKIPSKVKKQGLTTLYLAEKKPSECAHTTSLGGRSVGLCDLVIDSEECDITGSDRKAKYSLVIIKDKNRDGDGTALIFDLVETSKIKSYPGAKTDCPTMVKHLEAFKAKTEVAEATGDSGEQQEDKVKVARPE
jgi:hypothetical protein